MASSPHATRAGNIAVGLYLVVPLSRCERATARFSRFCIGKLLVFVGKFEQPSAGIWPRFHSCEQLKLFGLLEVVSGPASPGPNRPLPRIAIILDHTPPPGTPKQTRFGRSKGAMVNGC